MNSTPPRYSVRFGQSGPEVSCETRGASQSERRAALHHAGRLAQEGGYSDVVRLEWNDEEGYQPVEFVWASDVR